jgi:hypothetical protein
MLLTGEEKGKGISHFELSKWWVLLQGSMVNGILLIVYLTQTSGTV